LSERTKKEKLDLPAIEGENRKFGFGVTEE